MLPIISKFLLFFFPQGVLWIFQVRLKSEESSFYSTLCPVLSNHRSGRGTASTSAVPSSRLRKGAWGRSWCPGPIALAGMLHLVKASWWTMGWTPRDNQAVASADTGTLQSLRRRASLQTWNKELRKALLNLERGRQILNTSYQINQFKSAKLSCALITRRQCARFYEMSLRKAWLRHGHHFLTAERGLQVAVHHKTKKRVILKIKVKAWIRYGL